MTPQPTQQTIVYKSERKLQRGIAHMAKQGWRVTSQSPYTPRKGLIRTILGGFLFLNRRPRFVVVFERTPPLVTLPVPPATHEGLGAYFE